MFGTKSLLDHTDRNSILNSHAEELLKSCVSSKGKVAGDGDYPSPAAETLEGKHQIFGMEIHLSLKRGRNIILHVRYGELLPPCTHHEQSERFRYLATHLTDTRTNQDCILDIKKIRSEIYRGRGGRWTCGGRG